MRSIRVIDSHTGGEPTRLVLEGGPDLGDGPLAERAQRFREHFDDYRCAIVNEPRGSDPLVGALLVKPHRADCKFAGMLAPGATKIDTPVGAVDVELRPDGRISVANVVSYRAQSHLAVNVAGIGRVVGDVAWGGNWFYLVSE